MAAALGNEALVVAVVIQVGGDLKTVRRVGEHWMSCSH